MKSNLSFFKKRVSAGNSTPRNINSDQEQSSDLTLNSQFHRQLSLDFDKKVAILEEANEKGEITLEKIKELLELYAVMFKKKSCLFLCFFYRKQLNSMKQIMIPDI